MSSAKCQPVKIMIGGDVCPIRRNEPSFCHGAAAEIMGSLLSVWMEADFRIVNLEAPLIAKPAPIQKTGPHLGADECAVNGLKALGIDVVGIANNHILDHGPEGLLNTIRLCRKNGMAVVGGGSNLSEAQEPLICNINGLSLGIIAMADLEWSIAEGNSAGANPFSLSGFLKVMRRIRNECDHVIALMHLGKEYYPYPSPNLQEVCRCMVDEGVSIVVCQHSHCVGACEYYGNGFICYGQGNLVFDSLKSRMESWGTGHLLEVALAHGNPPSINSIPYFQRPDGLGIELLQAGDADAFYSRMHDMEQEIQDVAFVERKWMTFCSSQRDLYLSLLAGHGHWRRKFNQFTSMTTRMYSNEAISLLENIIHCEAHREVLHTVLRDFRTERWTGKK